MSIQTGALIDSIKSTGLPLVEVAIIILSLTIVIIILTWLLFRREKAFRLMSFSISATGLKLTYELNQDEKLQILALENIALQNEVKALKSTVKKERWNAIGLVLMMFVILILSRLKFKSHKVESIDSLNDKKN